MVVPPFNHEHDESIEALVRQSSMFVRLHRGPRTLVYLPSWQFIARLMLLSAESSRSEQKSLHCASRTR